MKYILPRKKFLDAVLLAERIVGKKESLPVLSCIYIEARDHEILIRSTNLEAGIEVRVPGEVVAKGIVAVPPSILAQTLHSMSGDMVSCVLEESNLLLESRGSKTLIKAVPHEEFPVLALHSEHKKGTPLSREKFIEALRAVSYAASQSMIRPELGSVFISLKASGIVCVATDSFRLAEKTISNGSRDDIGELLIPLKHALELIHILEHIVEEEVLVRPDDSQVIIEGGGAQFISRVIDSTFPNYKDIIPKTSTTEAVVLKTDFQEMLRKARLFSGTEQSVGLHIYPKRKTMSATARTNDVGEMSDILEGALTGEDLDINFHIGYLSDCLSSINSDSISLSFAGIGRPLVIKGVRDASFLYLVMPLNR